MSPTNPSSPALAIALTILLTAACLPIIIPHNAAAQSAESGLSLTTDTHKVHINQTFNVTIAPVSPGSGVGSFSDVNDVYLSITAYYYNQSDPNNQHACYDADKDEWTTNEAGVYANDCVIKANSAQSSTYTITQNLTITQPHYDQQGRPIDAITINARGPINIGTTENRYAHQSQSLKFETKNETSYVKTQDLGVTIDGYTGSELTQIAAFGLFMTWALSRGLFFAGLVSLPPMIDPLFSSSVNHPFGLTFGIVAIALALLIEFVARHRGNGIFLPTQGRR
jgi:hypothetical protein